MIPPFGVFWALFWVKSGWQAYFADTVGEVRRSFLSFGIEFIMLIGVWLLLGAENLRAGFADLILQSAISLAATACFLTLFATTALRFGYRIGLCRVIAAYNWLSLMMAVMVQVLVILSHVIASSSLLFSSNLLLFIWLNVTLFRLMQQAMRLPIVAIIAALALQALLAMIFLRATLSMQMHFTPVNVF